MDEQEGGIGGTGASNDQRRVPRREIHAAPDGRGGGEDGRHRSDLESRDRAMVDLTGLVVDAQEQVQQLRGQVNQLEQDKGTDRGQLQGIFNQINARFDAIAQRLAANERYLALQLAVNGRQPGEQHDRVTKNAEAYVEFLRKPETIPRGIDAGAAQADEGAGEARRPLGDDPERQVH